MGEYKWFKSGGAVPPEERWLCGVWGQPLGTVTKTDDGRWLVTAGRSNLGVVDSLEEAKKLAEDELRRLEAELAG